MKKKFKLEDKIIIAFVAIISLILFYCLILNPIIGRADNGDFGRMFALSGLADFNENNYSLQYDGFLHQYYIQKYPTILFFWNSDIMSGSFIVKFAVLFNYFTKWPINGNIFDIRILGFIYSAIFVTGIFLILKYKRFNLPAKIVAGILITLIFTDGVYIAYFNSFFGEATTISFMFLTIGTFLYLISRNEPRRMDFVIFYFASVMFLFSKTQETPLIVFMVIIYFALYKFYPQFKKLILKLSIFSVVICACVYLSIGVYTNMNNLYQAVFTGILYDSPTPEQDLEELHIDPKYAVLAGTSYDTKNLPYDVEGPEMMTDFYPNISFVKILKFYLNHPQRLMDKINTSANHAYEMFKIDDSNFVQGVNHDGKFVNSFRLYLINKFPDIHRSLFNFIVFSIIYLGALAYYFFKSKDKEVKLLTLLMLFVLAAGDSQLVLPVIGSGYGDFGKHLFLINISFDILVCSVIIWATTRVSKILVKCKIKN